MIVRGGASNGPAKPGKPVTIYTSRIARQGQEIAVLLKEIKKLVTFCNLVENFCNKFKTIMKRNKQRRLNG